MAKRANMSRIEHIINDAEQHCSKQGSRLTNKRKQVLLGLLKSQKALSAYELRALYQSEFGQALPPMSIYRILDFLVEENLVHKLAIVNKYIACEYTRCHASEEITQFLICRSCSKVKAIHIPSSAMENLRTRAHEVGFKLKNTPLEMPCLCQDCRSSEEEKNSAFNAH